MTSVFLLEHSFEEGEYDIVTFIGIYSTKKKAQEAMEKFKKYSKFKNHPEGFNIDEYVIDKDHWTEGFFTYDY